MVDAQRTDQVSRVARSHPLRSSHPPLRIDIDHRIFHHSSPRPSLYHVALDTSVSPTTSPPLTSSPPHFLPLSPPPRPQAEPHLISRRSWPPGAPARQRDTTQRSLAHLSSSTPRVLPHDPREAAVHTTPHTREHAHAHTAHDQAHHTPRLVLHLHSCPAEEGGVRICVPCSTPLVAAACRLGSPTNCGRRDCTSGWYSRYPKRRGTLRRF